MAMPMKAEHQSAVAQQLTSVILQILNQQLAGPKEHIANLDNRVENLEGRMAREGLTRSQGRTMQKDVAKKVGETVKLYPFSTPQSHFANVYGSLKDKFNVPSYLDIPRDKYQTALELISTYDGSGRNWWHD